MTDWLALPIWLYDPVAPPGGLAEVMRAAAAATYLQQWLLNAELKKWEHR